MIEKNVSIPNFALNTLFEFINLIIEYKTFEPLSANILNIEELVEFGLSFNKIPRKYSSNALIKINMFLRKVLLYMEIFSDGFKENTLSTILKVCKIKTDELVRKKTQAETDNLNDELNDSMITEFAETISR